MKSSSRQPTLTLHTILFTQDQRASEDDLSTHDDQSIKVTNNGGLFPDQSYGGDDQHDEGKDHQPHDRPDVEAVLVVDTRVRPVRKISRY
jgi:hypothetical protein